MTAKHERLYDLDWLRVLAFMILMLYHTGMVFVGWDFHLMSKTSLPALRQPMIFTHFWRLALLFLISGAGTWFSLRRRGTGAFLRERLTRLLIPLAFGMIVIVPPQIYVERLAQGIIFNSYWDFQRTVFNMVPYPEGNLSWHHLWFVAYLLVSTLMLTPLLVSLRSGRLQAWRDRMVGWLSGSIWRLHLPALALAAVSLGLRWRWPDTTHALIDDWATFAHFLLLFFLGFLLAADPRVRARTLARWRLSLVLALGWYLAFRLALPHLRDTPLLYPFYWTMAPIFTWLIIIAILGAAQRWLTRPTRFLRYANEAVYPYYILHQSVMLVITPFALGWNVSAWSQYLAILLGMFAITALLYELIRRFRPTRLLFGMRVDGKAPKGALQAAI